jgi:hypothetical protein
MLEMTASALQDTPPFAGHSPNQERPLGAYASMTTVFTGICAAFAAWLRSSDHELPERVATGDLALGMVATHKAARLITRDRVTSTVRAPFTTFQEDAGHGEVEEAARGHGLRRAIGELLVCPYCLDVWLATLFLAGLIVAPRPTRWVASLFTILTGADMLQLAYRKAADAA